MTSSPQKVSPYYQDVDGFRIPGFLSVEAFRSGLAYKPRPDDLFVVTYPKCGTTWVQTIIALIFRHGEPFRDAMESLLQTPNLLAMGASAALTMKRPGTIKLHLPFHMTPYHSGAKYIFVARNPKDCCVSLYHHLKSLDAFKFEEGNFDDLFELFIRGEVAFGDYFDTLLSWYGHRKDPNVLFFSYEQLKEDTKKYVLEIAGFMGERYKDDLERDPDLLRKVLEFSSFDYMKETLNKSAIEMKNTPNELILSNPNLPEGLRYLLSVRSPKRKVTSPSNYVRKGIVGDWRNHFTKEQSRRLEEKFRKRTEGTDLLQLWENYM